MNVEKELDFVKIQFRAVLGESHLLQQHHVYRRVPNSKIHGANMGPIWSRQDPSGPHVGPMNFAIWGENQGYVNTSMYIRSLMADNS